MENKGKVPEEAICYWGKENPSLSVEIAYPPYFLGRMDFPPENRIFLITGMVGVDRILSRFVFFSENELDLE